MKRGREIVLVLVFLIGILLMNLSLVCSDFAVGEEDSIYELEVSYAPSEAIRGWINISLDEEPADSLLTGFQSYIRLEDFLSANEIHCSLSSCSCFPLDCEPYYSATGNGENSKTISISEAKTGFLGIKLEDNIESVFKIGFNVTTNAGRSCIFPLKIDILNDGTYEWESKETSEEHCYIKTPYGCFNSKFSKSSANITSNLYCNVIEIPPSRGFRLGAKVIGNGTASFQMSVDIGEDVGCDILNIDNGGEISCIVELSEAVEEYINATVCIKALSNHNYKIRYEDRNICGYSLDSEGNQYPHDFEIFAKPLKYESIRNVVLDERYFDEDEYSELINSISYYISDKYEGDCSKECVIPIKFQAGTSQQLIVSNFALGYNSKGFDYEESKIYNIEKKPPLISSDFLKLDLEKANLLVPSDYGNENFILNLGDKNILEDEITVKKIPQIKGIFPREPPILVPVNFFVILEREISRGNLTYSWNFGEGINQVSEENNKEYTYSEIGEYDLTVSVSNDYGESSKTFKIKTVAPSQGINKTIKEYKENLKNLENQINPLPEWIKKEVEKHIDIIYLKSQVDKLETKYKSTLRSETEELVEIMRDLLGLEVPFKIGKGQIINQVKFFQSEDQIDTLILEELGAGSLEESADYYNAMNNWILKNLDANLESETYSFFYENGKKEDIFSHVKIVLEPKQNLDEFYLVINGDPENIKIKEDLKLKYFEESGIGITFIDLEGTQTIEFLHPEEVNLFELPIYISPEFQDLEFSVLVGECNHNGKCERGEDYKNCRSDCKPWKLVIIFLIILLGVVFIIYIVLQEWYKRHYESHLFKSRNQLFNLIFFMNNSVKIGKDKKEIMGKLLKLGWSKEQLTYAWKKFRGKRTGMWEIPIFGILDKIKIKKEINKRKIKGNVPPKNLYQKRH